MCRKSDLKSVKDCKVIPGDYVAKQHRPVVAIVSWMQKKISSMSTEKKTKWWNLRIEEKKEAFYLEMKEHLKKQIEANWSETSKFMRECAERLLGVTSGKVMVEKENWWWNDEVQEAIKWKKEKKREKYTINAKSLGTLTAFYDLAGERSPLPFKTMLI